MDTQLFYFINNFSGQSKALDGIFVFCATSLGIMVISAGIIFFLLHRESEGKLAVSYKAFKRRVAEITVAFVGSGIALLVTEVVKNIIARPRPFISLENAHQLIIETKFDSFPSGHATFFMALAIAIFLYHRKYGAGFLLVAVIIGISRILVGVHYPSDILAGWGIGAITIVAVRFMYLKLAKL